MKFSNFVQTVDVQESTYGQGFVYAEVDVTERRWFGKPTTSRVAIYRPHMSSFWRVLDTGAKCISESEALTQLAEASRAARLLEQTKPTPPTAPTPADRQGFEPFTYTERS